MLKKRTYIIFGLLIAVNIFTFIYIMQTPQNSTTKIHEYGKLNLDSDTLNRDDRVDYRKKELTIFSTATYQVSSGRRSNEENHFNENVIIINSEPPVLRTEFSQASNESNTEPTETTTLHSTLPSSGPIENCATFPKLDELQFHNDYWQIYRNKNITFQLYGAYLDKRASVVSEQGTTVRILAMINQNEAAFPSSFCKLWFDEEDSEPLVVPVAHYLSIWPKKWGNSANNSFPHLVGCILPKESNRSTPEYVALVKEACTEPTNLLKVQFTEPPATPEFNTTKQGFAVCLKGLNFPDADISGRLIEWLEMMRLLGAAKVYAYNLAVHPNITKVLSYYEESEFIEVTPLTLADGVLDLSGTLGKSTKSTTFRKRMNELIPYNDCFYRHMYEYDYIALIDIDELIMPLGNLSTWRDIVTVAEATRKPSCSASASICFRNTFFPTYEKPKGEVDAAALPHAFYMLEHVHRLPEHNRIGSATKCLHNTQHVISLHNHYPRKWVQSCAPQTVNVSVAQLQHYREVKKKVVFAEAVFDDNIWRYSEVLLNRSMTVLEQLELL